MEKIIFYKLESPYTEDETKNCKLTVTELDSNFLALKDNSLSSGTFDKESYTLYLTKNNGENIAIDLSVLSGVTDIIHEIEYKTPEIEISGSYSGDTLNLNVEYSGYPESRQSINISGFSVATESKLYHDSSLTGEGTQDNPLKHNPLYDTNSYELCHGIIDILPLEKKIGDRYVYIQNVNNVGYLYNGKGVKTIAEALKAEGSSWRIPTKSDWDTLLNSCEGYDELKNHSTEEDGVYGGMAGFKLKSLSGWSYSDNSLDMNILPTGHNADNVLTTGFWTSTDNKVKIFTDKLQGVQQKTVSENDAYSIRLVSNTYEDEYILGSKYEQVHIESTGQYWTKTNLSWWSNSVEEYQPDKTYNETHKTYSIVRWNGSEWEIFELKNGSLVNVWANDSIIRYQMIDNELVKLSETSLLGNYNYKTTIDAGWY